MYLSALLLLLMNGALVWRMAFAGRIRMPLRCIVVVFASLGLTAAIVVMIIAVSVVVGGIWLWMPAVLLTSVVLTVPKTVLIGTMRPLGRKITVTVIGMWMMIWVVGWCWYLAMDDGVEAFTGREHLAAERVLNEEKHCPSGPYPISARVVKDSNGQCQVLCYQWWGIGSR